MKTLNQFNQMIDAHLNLLGIDRAQLDVFWESGQILNGSNQDSELGLHYLDLEYRLVLNIENLPNRSLALLALLVKRFVDGLNRDALETVSMDFSPHHQGESLDIEISFGVRDPVHLVEVANSPIEFQGKKWGFGEAEFFIADSVDQVRFQ